MNAKFVIVRHGQTDWNVAHRFQGQSDTPLNAIGEAQARQAGQALAQAQGAAIDAIITSDLQRARRTAEIITEALEAVGLAVPEIVPEPRLREMSFGAWEGLTYAEIQARDAELLERWGADLEHSPPPGGETLLDMAQRVKAAQADLLATRPQGTTLLVSHGGPLQLWIALALGLPPGRFWQLHLSNASISELAVYPEGAILNLLNSCAHLK
jgi:broad specificity phosphatase PhoE